MTTPILRGTKTPQLQWWEADFSPTRGSRSAQQWRGIDITQMGALAQTYLNAGWSGKLRYEKNVATLDLEATYTSGVPGLDGNGSFSDIVDKWEIAVDQEKPELFENQQWLKLFASADAAYLAAGSPPSQQISHWVKKIANGSEPIWKTLWDTLHGEPFVKLDGTNYTIGTSKMSLAYVVDTYVPGSWQAIKYFTDDYFRGATNFIRGKYIVRHTTSAPQNYNLNIADFNVEKIYTISQLLTECQNGSLWINVMPNYMAYKVLWYPVPVAMPPNFMWGALKLRSDAITAAKNRIEIKTEFLLDVWPKHSYGSI